MKEILIRGRALLGSKNWLPNPQIFILPDFGRILEAISDSRYVGELRQRWLEIKKIHADPSLAVAKV